MICMCIVIVDCGVWDPVAAAAKSDIHSPVHPTKTIHWLRVVLHVVACYSVCFHYLVTWLSK